MTFTPLPCASRLGMFSNGKKTSADAIAARALCATCWDREHCTAERIRAEKDGTFYIFEGTWAGITTASPQTEQRQREKRVSA